MKISVIIATITILIFFGSSVVNAEQNPHLELKPYVSKLIADIDPATVAAELPSELLTDLPALNSLRMQLKAANKSSIAQDFFTALAARQDTDAVLLNLSLTFVDQIPGKNLLRKGYLSTMSQNVATKLTRRDPNHWIAWYIRGLNNLYWPAWFKKAKFARDYLQHAIDVRTSILAATPDHNDMYAFNYLALGDAYGMLGQLDLARKTWELGQLTYPYVDIFKPRLELPGTSIYAAVLAARDSDQPIDTNLTFTWQHHSQPYDITLTSGTLFGPGSLPDQPLNPGKLAKLHLSGALSGYIPAFNNGPELPNLPGEVLQAQVNPMAVVDGLLSDGTQANENIDVGFVSLLNHKFNLFLAAIQDGPHHGKINFFLDGNWNWTIWDDIGIDPGFAVGIVKINNFTFSTGPRIIPYSRQTEANYPAGVDRAGSLISNSSIVPGYLGDANFDGFLDGTFNAIGRFPYDSVILPGAPFAQTRIFNSKIPITPEQATLLTLANANNYLQLAINTETTQPELAANLRQIFSAQMLLVTKHLATSHLFPVEITQLIQKLNAKSDTADLCNIWKLLDDNAATYGLTSYKFNNQNMSSTCPQ
ncbi:hypothetical protein TI04_00530 [Achromatium sp. WMS2]|nr:hypothetical protein TI04_00530 [Achromatium sp. WMS2]